MGAGRSMSFIGTAGVVAQQGNNAAAVAPTSVSIATSSTGNYDDAFLTQCHDGSAFQSQIHNQTGGTFSSNTGNTELDSQAIASWFASNSLIIYIGAYLRATGATSYSYTLSSLTYNVAVPGVFIPSLVTSSMSTSQDATYSTAESGIGGYVGIAAGGGRGGLTWGDAGDWIQFKVKGTATNSAGSTNSDEITCKITWTAGDAGD